MRIPEALGERLYVIDDYDLGQAERTGTYVLVDEQITLIEACASPSLPHILEGLAALHIPLEDVAYLIVTHVHLDHAGGAGLLLEKCPNAKLIVHPRGARHMVNPAKLIAGARAVYGDEFDTLFNPIVPIPEERVLTMQDGETLSIGARTLTFYDTPGHAAHHMSIHDSLTNGIFTGDTIGVYYRGLHGLDFVLPSTSPSQFQPEAMLESLARIEAMNVDRIYFGHYGTMMDTAKVYAQIRHWLPRFLACGQAVFAEEKEFAAASAQVSEQLTAQIRAYLSEQGVKTDHPVYKLLQVDMDVCAMGLIDYLAKQE